MKRIVWGAGAALVVGMGLIGPACTSDGFLQAYSKPLYIGGNCGFDDADCHSLSNNIPGSICVQHKCVCLDGMALCCPGGQWDEVGNPLNCKIPEDYRCRPEGECNPVLPPPPPPEPECDAVDDCPSPPDFRCGEATCEDGKCGLNFYLSDAPIAWQALGDCRTAYCDGSGNVIFKEEPTDLPKTPNPCVIDSCEGSQPVHTPLLDGEPCLDTTGVCATFETTSGPVLKCVECIWPNQSTCTLDHYCQGPGVNFCVPEHCLDQFNDPDETGPNCGGPHCAPCPIDETCFTGSDCVEGSCKNGVCKGPTHDDGVKNDGEAGIDCGCAKCATLCKDGDTCELPEHCVSGACYAGICQAPTCFDMVKNGTEQGVDCGGNCEFACPLQSAPGGP
jgi:hypothetical protein